MGGSVSTLIIDKSICWIIREIEYPIGVSRTYATDKVLSRFGGTIVWEKTNADVNEIATIRQYLKLAGDDANEFFIDVLELGLCSLFLLRPDGFTLDRSLKSIEWQFIENLVFGKLKSIYGYSQVLRLQ